MSSRLNCNALLQFPAFPAISFIKPFHFPEVSRRKARSSGKFFCKSEASISTTCAPYPLFKCCADSSLPIFQYNSIVALVILRAIWILELMISANKIVSLLTRLKDVCALRDMTSADICCHLMKCLYHGLLSPPIFAFEFNFMSHLKRFYNEKENPFFSAFRVFRGRLFCTGTRACGHQRSHEHVDLVFRSGNQTVLCHRCGAGVGRGYQDLQQVFKRRSRYQQDGSQLVFRLYIFDCSRHHPAFLLPLAAMEYEINKGAGNPLEFKGAPVEVLWQIRQ